MLLEAREARLPKSVDFSIDYLRSAGPEDCHAACELVRQGRRVAQVQVRCWQADMQRPIAIARAHFLLTALPGGGPPEDAAQAPAQSASSSASSAR